MKDIYLILCVVFLLFITGLSYGTYKYYKYWVEQRQIIIDALYRIENKEIILECNP